MAGPAIELRVATLEAEITLLKQKLDAVTNPAIPWWREIYGTFSKDPLYKEAMRLGSGYRKSLRPKLTKPSTKRSARRKQG